MLAKLLFYLFINHRMHFHVAVFKDNLGRLSFIPPLFPVIMIELIFSLP